jgi:hypothetical protein
MAKPKLALIPATQGSKLYSVLPADGVGDFTFSRNSAATRINKDGLIETVAVGKSRLNYPLIDGVVNGCPSHLLEPSRLQLIQYSEDFSQSSWVKASVTVDINSSISPDGTLNADKITESSTNGLQQIYSNVITTTPSSDYVYSIFIKKGERSWVKVMTANNNGANFNVEDGVIGIVDSGITANIENYGNGWFKCSVSFNTSASADRVYVRISTSNGTTSYQGDGTSGVYIWGAQLEQGSYPTSYIPNYGTSAGITRVAETANGAGDASTFNDSEGVLMAEISALADDGDGQIRLMEQGVLNSVIMQFRNSGTTLRTYIFDGNATNQFLSETNINPNDNIKIALKYKQNDCSLYLNGFISATDTIATMPSNLNTLSFNQGDGNYPFYGSVKQIQYFDSALNDSDLEKITSWTSFTDLANGQTYSIK